MRKKTLKLTLYAFVVAYTPTKNIFKPQRGWVSAFQASQKGKQTISNEPERNLAHFPARNRRFTLANIKTSRIFMAPVPRALAWCVIVAVLFSVCFQIRCCCHQFGNSSESPRTWKQHTFQWSRAVMACYINNVLMWRHAKLQASCAQLCQLGHFALLYFDRENQEWLSEIGWIEMFLQLFEMLSSNSIWN